MGIPSYFAHIVRKHRNIIKPISSLKDSPKINNLYLDCNSFIYEAHQLLIHHADEKQKSRYEKDRLLFETELIKKAGDNLFKLIHHEKILLAFDAWFCCWCECTTDKANDCSHQYSFCTV